MYGAIEPPVREDWILWKVVEEHLDEVSFCLKRWMRALDSPSYTLDDVTRRPEERLLAHVDGLVVGGEPVARRLLEPQLEAPEKPAEDRAAAAALGLLGQGRQDVVRAALDSDKPPTRRGAQRALVLFGAPGFDQWVIAQLSAPLPESRRRVLLSIAAERELSPPDLREPLSSQDPEEVVAAATAARRADPGRHLHFIEQLTTHAEPLVRDTALVTALLLGSFDGFARCSQLASDARAPSAAAMLLVALLGGPAHHELLLQHLAHPKHRYPALYALGLSGNAGMVGAVLPYLDPKDPRAARLAGEAVSTITGLDITQAPYTGAPPPEPDSLPPLEKDDLQANLVPTAEDELPMPAADAVTEFWRTRAGMFDRRMRLLRGEPWTAARAIDLLWHAPMRLRHPVALWLRLRSGGAARINTRTLTSVQRWQLGTVQNLTDEALVYWRS
jgi:uncharacterized protein (TIGR02270 family)